MGQKVNPHGLRVGVIKNWDSRWYAKDEQFGDILVSDYNIREYLKNKLLWKLWKKRVQRRILTMNPSAESSRHSKNKYIKYLRKRKK